MKRTSITWFTVGMAAIVILILLSALSPVATTASSGSHGVVFSPTAVSWQMVKGDEPPPTAQDCYDAGFRCFAPSAIANAYNYAVLHAAGNQGQGVTIAIIDSFGSDTIRHDLHVFNQAFGLQPMCGEEGVTCTPGKPTFEILHLQGSPAPGAQPPNNGTGLESKFGWAVETSLDVEWAHATAPMANILLVTTPTSETFGVQGFPPMMNALQYIVDNDLADVVSMSLGAGEGSFHNGLAALQQMRQGIIDAKVHGITILASTGDSGTANQMKEPPKKPALIPYPSVSWPASDPLVTAVGGTRLCMDTDGQNVDTSNPPDSCGPGVNTLLLRETAWPLSGGGYSILFPRPSFQNSLPTGSTFVGSSVGAPPPNTNMRGTPDIAYNASGATAVLVFFDGFWFAVGGTSAGAPQWAGLIAMADQIAGHNVGYINPALYQIASDPAKYAKDFFDPKELCNQVDPSIPGYCASTGWDAVTGLGTPNAANLLPDLIAASP